MTLADRSFLVTGAGSGLGAAVAARLVREGARVTLADIAAREVEAMAEELGAAARFVRCDVTSEADAGAAVAGSVAAFGALHGLVNCARIVLGERIVGREGPHRLDSFARVIGINLIGTFNMVRLAAAAMAGNAPTPDGERGVIVNTASVAAFDGQIGQVAYAASKAGVAGMTLPLARDLARSGIRVVAIAPGLFDTAMMAGLPAEAKASLGASVPFPPRLGDPAEFASLVIEIIRNPMLNGATIRLDGALRMGPR